MSSSSEYATFWEHLDELRMRIIRVLVVVVAFAVVAFLLKDLVFSIVLAPKSGDFVSYRLLGVPPFSIHLINIIYELFRFVSPGLYSHERRYALWLVGSAYVMFILGTLLDYYLIFPLTVRFLGTYQVSADVTNMLTLQSYIDTLISMSFLMGVLFELPVVCWLMGRMGIINGQLMSTYRRHAIVAILVLAAIVTPTTDVFTLFVVALPIWMLYEMSILIVKASKL